MGLGASVRRAFGPWEREVASAYRAIYLDLGVMEQALAPLFRAYRSPIAA